MPPSEIAQERDIVEYNSIMALPVGSSASGLFDLPSHLHNLDIDSSNPSQSVYIVSSVPVVDTPQRNTPRNPNPVDADPFDAVLLAAGARRLRG
jgi:hypothetical protein